jgi:hypothetical protein
MFKYILRCAVINNIFIMSQQQDLSDVIETKNVRKTLSLESLY